jgi:DNA adenine methylase
MVDSGAGAIILATMTHPTDLREGCKVSCNHKINCRPPSTRSARKSSTPSLRLVGQFPVKWLRDGMVSDGEFTIHPFEKTLELRALSSIRMTRPRWGSLRPARELSARPFLKWAGGKGQVYRAIKPQLHEIGPDATYFEPFLGGGAVFFQVKPRRAVLNDLNAALIATFEEVKSGTSKLLSQLHRLPAETTEPEYYERRDRFNHLGARLTSLGPRLRSEFAATFIWLNHTCYNGLYRVNKSGRFNVPFGFYERPFIYSESSINLAAKALQRSHARLRCVDYEECLRAASSGDLVYLDPPYEPSSPTSSFTGYTSEGFGTSDQEKLAHVVRNLVRRGCHVVLSNSPSPNIRDLYKGFKITTVSAPRAINCVGSRRARVDELVVVG